MKRNILFLLLIPVFLVTLALGTNVFAYPTSSDDLNIIQQLDGGRGGRFKARYGDRNNSSTWRTFLTFCLEYNETISVSPNAWYSIQSISPNAIGGGVGPAGDPISSQTAFLYTQFVAGAYDFLGGGGANTTATQYRNLQKAIWEYEGEGPGWADGIASVLGSIAYFKSLADSSGFTGIGSVRAINLGPTVQDQLTINVPEPTAILLSGLGLLGMGFYLRRRFKRV